MSIEFKKVGEFKRGILFELLADTYSFSNDIVQDFGTRWKENDNFFFDNLHIADECCFITTLNDKAIGFICWDPRNMLDYVEIGDNCIITDYKGNGYGKLQLKEAINRISSKGCKSIIVTTSDILIPAQRMYESVGFTLDQSREKKNSWDINYILSVSNLNLN